jgi:hypothetical protein
MDGKQEKKLASGMGRQLFYGLVFTITFFVGFLYVLTVVL